MFKRYYFVRYRVESSLPAGNSPALETRQYSMVAGCRSFFGDGVDTWEQVRVALGKRHPQGLFIFIEEFRRL